MLGAVFVGMLRGRREERREFRPNSQRACDLDEAVMLLDDPIHHREPETRALAHFLRGVKRLKDSM